MRTRNYLDESIEQNTSSPGQETSPTSQHILKVEEYHTQTNTIDKQLDVDGDVQQST